MNRAMIQPCTRQKTGRTHRRVGGHAYCACDPAVADTMGVPNKPSPLPPEINTPVAENWCYTRMNVVKCTYIWTINYFSLRREGVGEFLKSSYFSSDSDDVLKWRLRAYPKGETEGSKGYLSLYLKLVSCNTPEVWANFQFSILNAERQKTNTLKNLQPHRFVQNETLGWNQFIRREFLLNKAYGLLPGDELTIFCELSVLADSVNTCGQSNSVKFKVPECRLSEDLGKLLSNQTISDVTFYVGGREIRAHKALLAARSKVFAAMFEHEMLERRNNLVNITDVGHDVLREMLRFVYTGRTTSLANMAEDLLVAADKYALERLKVMCEEALSRNLSLEKVVHILILADMHSAYQLKTQAINYIKTHTMAVMQTQGWKQMILSHPHLVAEVFSVLAIQQTPLDGPPSKCTRKS